MPIDYEWHENKRRLTLEDRGLDFADAEPLFDGRAVVESPARSATEPRTLTVGRLDDGKPYAVVWTWRGQVRRIIPFRRAHRDEERRYDDHRDDRPELQDR